ncbi:MAG: TauD/TfdA family dioxygenase [Ilumatobacter sp.]
MIDELNCEESGIGLRLDGKPLRLSWGWLRDHARDETSFLASAQQRLVTPTVVAAAGRATVERSPGGFTARWPDGTTAEFATDFLRTLTAPGVTQRIDIEPDPWVGADMVGRSSAFDHRAVIDDDDGLRVALNELWKSGVITLSDAPVDHAVTRAVLERFGYVRRTIFGEMWEFSSDGGFDDTASTPREITPHTDGTYSHDAPGLLGLHCHEYDATGGENVFVDAHALAPRLTPAAREILSTVDIPGQYIGDGAHLVARRPALRHEANRLVQVSYNHHDRAPFLLPEPQMSALYDALGEFDALANDPDLQFELAMRPGDMVIFDNWRVLHGRRAFSGRRLIAGGYVNREDVESTTRRLA